MSNAQLYVIKTQLTGSTRPPERAEPLKRLGGQLRSKLACGKLSTERRSFSGV